VLTDYAQRWRADLPHLAFSNRLIDEIRKVAGYFGVVFWPEEGAITHTSSTAIVDPTGRLAAMVEGSSFTSQQLVDLVQSLLPIEPRPSGSGPSSLRQQTSR